MPCTASRRGLQTSTSAVEAHGGSSVFHLELSSAPTEYIGAPLEDSLDCVGTYQDVFTIGWDAHIAQETVGHNSIPIFAPRPMHARRDVPVLQVGGDHGPRLSNNSVAGPGLQCSHNERPIGEDITKPSYYEPVFGQEVLMKGERGVPVSHLHAI